MTHIHSRNTGIDTLFTIHASESLLEVTREFSRLGKAVNSALKAVRPAQVKTFGITLLPGEEGQGKSLAYRCEQEGTIVILDYSKRDLLVARPCDLKNGVLVMSELAASLARFNCSQNPYQHLLHDRYVILLTENNVEEVHNAHLCADAVLKLPFNDAGEIVPYRSMAAMNAILEDPIDTRVLDKHGVLYSINNLSRQASIAMKPFYKEFEKTMGRTVSWDVMEREEKRRQILPHGPQELTHLM